MEEEKGATGAMRAGGDCATLALGRGDRAREDMLGGGRRCGGGARSAASKPSWGEKGSKWRSMKGKG